MMDWLIVSHWLLDGHTHISKLLLVFYPHSAWILALIASPVQLSALMVLYVDQGPILQKVYVPIIQIL